MNAQTQSRIDLLLRCNNLSPRAAASFECNKSLTADGERVQRLLMESEELHRQKFGGGRCWLKNRGRRSVSVFCAFYGGHQRYKVHWLQNTGSGKDYSS